MKLIKMDKDRFRMMVTAGHIEAPLPELKNLLGEFYGVHTDEIDYAIKTMASHDHNEAIFGVGLTERGPLFIFSQRVMS